MKRVLYCSFAFGLVLIPGRVLAQGDVAGQDGAPIQLESVQLQSVDNAGVATWRGVDLGPYAGWLTSDPTQPAFTLYEVEYEHDTRPTPSGATAKAAETSAASGASNSDSRTPGFGTYWTGGFMAALLVAWSSPSHVSAVSDGVRDGQRAVGYRFAGSAAPGTSSFAWSGIHAATWALTSAYPSFPAAGSLVRQPGGTSGPSGGFQSFVGAPTSSLTTLQVQSTPVEETLGHTTVTPEPQTFVMLGTGILFLVGVARRRRVGQVGDV